MFTALYSLAKPVLWMVALIVLESGTGEPQSMFVLPFVEGLVCLFMFIAGVQFLVRLPQAARTSFASCIALLVLQAGIVIVRPSRIVEGGHFPLRLWLTHAHISFWVLPILLALACLIATLLAQGRERLLAH